MLINYALLAQASLDATTNTDLLVVGVDEQVVATLNMVNRTGDDIAVRVALSGSNAPTDAEWIEYGIILKANGGALERTGLTLQTGKHIVVYAAAIGVSAAVWGMKLTPEAP